MAVGDVLEIGPDGHQRFATPTGGGGVTVLEDPGEVWEALTVVALGYRIGLDFLGDICVFEVTTAGTTGESSPPFDQFLTARATVGPDGTATWTYIGRVGELPWTVLPPDILPTEISTDDGEVLITHVEAPVEGANLFSLRATDGAPVPVFEIQTDGDADWTFEDGNSPGMRWNNRGNAYHTDITYEGVSVVGQAGTFSLFFSPFSVAVTGLPTADPTIAGQLWIDTAAGRVLKVSAG